MNVRVTAEHKQIVKDVFRSTQGTTCDDKQAKQWARQILLQTRGYYLCGDRSTANRMDDFYYDVKEFFRD